MSLKRGRNGLEKKRSRGGVHDASTQGCAYGGFVRGTGAVAVGMRSSRLPCYLRRSSSVAPAWLCSYLRGCQGGSGCVDHSTGSLAVNNKFRTGEDTFIRAGAVTLL